MSALFIFAATFAVVLFLGLQSLNVNGGHKLLAVTTSFMWCACSARKPRNDF